MNAPSLARGALGYALLIAAVAGLWDRPQWLLGAMLVMSAGALLVMRTRRHVVLYVVGTVLGPLGESIAIRSGAWSYSSVDSLFPIWLPPAWGLAAVMLVEIANGLGPKPD